MAYSGRWLHVDLTHGTHSVGETDRDLLAAYIGGKGLGYALLDRMGPAPDPLGPDNPLIFVNGPFTGTPVQTSARTCLVTRSPLTGSLLDSHCGGHFGPRLKAAGYDYLMITGRAEKPVYLYVTDEKLEIRDASGLWGKGTFEVTMNCWPGIPEKIPGRPASGPPGKTSAGSPVSARKSGGSTGVAARAR